MTLPPRPNLLTAADRAQLDPNRKLTPTQKRAALAMLAGQLQKALSEHPTFQPLTVTVDTRPNGFSLHCDIPPDGPDDLTLPGME